MPSPAEKWAEKRRRKRERFNESVLQMAENLENPDFHIGLADRGYVAYLLRKLVGDLN